MFQIHKRNSIFRQQLDEFTYHVVKQMPDTWLQNEDIDDQRLRQSFCTTTGGLELIRVTATLMQVSVHDRVAWTRERRFQTENWATEC